MSSRIVKNKTKRLKAGKKGGSRRTLRNKKHTKKHTKKGGLKRHYKKQSRKVVKRKLNKKSRARGGNKKKQLKMKGGISHLDRNTDLIIDLARDNKLHGEEGGGTEFYPRKVVMELRHEPEALRRVFVYMDKIGGGGISGIGAGSYFFDNIDEETVDLYKEFDVDTANLEGADIDDHIKEYMKETGYYDFPYDEDTSDEDTSEDEEEVEKPKEKPKEEKGNMSIVSDEFLFDSSDSE